MVLNLFVSARRSSAWAVCAVATLVLTNCSLVDTPNAPAPEASSTPGAAKASDYAALSARANKYDKPPRGVLDTVSQMQGEAPSPDAWRWIRSFGKSHFYAALTGSSVCASIYNPADGSAATSCKHLSEEGYLAVRSQDAENDITLMVVPDEVIFADLGAVDCRAAGNAVVIDHLAVEQTEASLYLDSGDAEVTPLPPSSANAPDVERPSQCG